MDARLVTVNDLYAFDPNKVVSVREFEDIIGRHFKQPNPFSRSTGSRNAFNCRLSAQFPNRAKRSRFGRVH